MIFFCQQKLDSKLTEAYAKYKDADGFLYIQYCEYDPFGSDETDI